MAKSTFTYAAQSDLRDIFPDYGKYLSQRQIYGFVEETTNVWKAHSVGTAVSMVYFDGEEGVAASPPASEGQWDYDTNDDVLTIYTATDPNDDQIIEIGKDKDTFIGQVLVNASSEINAMLDAKFPRPIPKTFLYSADPDNDEPQYDPILIRAVCLTAIKNLAITAQDYETAESIYKEVSNEDSTGIIDKINDGKIKLAFEVDRTDKHGNIIEVTRVGSMHLVELAGKFSGGLYDRIQCICTTEGAYGTAKVSVKVYDGNALYATITENVIITGGLQIIAGGLYGRWQGPSMSVNDRWDIEVRASQLPQSNAGIKSAQLTK